MIDEIIHFFGRFFSNADFPARWYCGQWSNFHGWLYILSNFAIAGAYFTIPLALAQMIRRRKDLPFRRIFWLFVSFILFCGTTHFIDAIIFWLPIYRWNALILFSTALVSWTTAVVLVKVMPKILELKTTQQLKEVIRQKTQELEIANRRLTESERQFRTLVDYNPDVVARVGRDQKFKFINPAIKNLTGLRPEYYLDKPVEELSNFIAASPRFGYKIKTVFEQGQLAYYETAARESERFYAVSIAPLYDQENQKVEDALLIIRDITFQKKAETELRENVDQLQVLSQSLTEKNQKLESFAHIVSHNLRAPIGNINMLLNLHEEEDDTNERNLLLTNIKEVSQKLFQTVEDLTEVVRSQRSAPEDQKEIDLEEALKSQMANISAEIQLSEPGFTMIFTMPQNTLSSDIPGKYFA
ncbi:MAG: PAS domain-containing sensor histidine kinase [Bacteroidia bacterium]|nr:PAS domain-containing sensor histidine kinase [Bacteroidia bacterium]